MPFSVGLGEEVAVVEAGWAVLPEFYGDWVELEALPVGGAGDFARFRVGEGLGELLDLGFEEFSACERAGLLADVGADLAGSGAAVEVGVGRGGGEWGDGAFDADLATEGFPVEAEGGAGVLGEFLAFAALGVGEDAEAVVAYVLDQDHADAGGCGERGGGEGGGVGVVGFGFGGLSQPLVEELERVGRLGGVELRVVRHGLMVDGLVGNWGVDQVSWFDGVVGRGIRGQ